MELRSQGNAEKLLQTSCQHTHNCSSLMKVMFWITSKHSDRYVALLVFLPISPCLQNILSPNKEWVPWGTRSLLICLSGAEAAYFFTPILSI
jgi:hypothetical protein